MISKSRDPGASVVAGVIREHLDELLEQIADGHSIGVAKDGF